MNVRESTDLYPLEGCEAICTVLFRKGRGKNSRVEILVGGETKREVLDALRAAGLSTLDVTWVGSSKALRLWREGFPAQLASTMLWSAGHHPSKRERESSYATFRPTSASA